MADTTCQGRQLATESDGSRCTSLVSNAHGLMWVNNLKPWATLLCTSKGICNLIIGSPSILRVQEAPPHGSRHPPKLLWSGAQSCKPGRLTWAEGGGNCQLLAFNQPGPCSSEAACLIKNLACRIFSLRTQAIKQQSRGNIARTHKLERCFGCPGGFNRVLSCLGNPGGAMLADSGVPQCFLPVRITQFRVCTLANQWYGGMACTGGWSQFLGSHGVEKAPTL